MDGVTNGVLVTAAQALELGFEIGAVLVRPMDVALDDVCAAGDELAESEAALHGSQTIVRAGRAV
jgi:hypothetical protein